MAIEPATALEATLNPAVATLAYLVSALRLVAFDRRGYRCRRGISLLATVVIGVLLCAAIDLLLNPTAVSLWQALPAVLLCFLVYRANGNLAALIRTNR